MTFGLVYAFNENFVLPLSHDEVVHGKRSLLGRMPGDDWQQFANLRAYFGFMYAHPGKKLLFMGSELAQRKEWNHDRSLDWHLLEHAAHAGVHRFVCDLNALYRRTPALHEIDFSPDGFEWLDWNDRQNSVLSWLRRGRDGSHVICITNLTPVVRHAFRIGVPEAGRYGELLNSDDLRYGGSGIRNPAVVADAPGVHGRRVSITLRLPPLATIILKRESD
jgi:1,4-alpha-glucan branching enzyme